MAARFLGLLAAAFVLVSSPARAGEKPFSSGALYYDATVTITTQCYIANNGKKPVTLSSPQILNFVGPSGPATSDDCTTAPLPPGEVCGFSGSAGVYGGGLIFVKGSTKGLRGRCSFKNPSNVEVTFSDMF